VKAKVEVCPHPAPTDHKATNHHISKNWEGKLKEESLPAGTDYII